MCRSNGFQVVIDRHPMAEGYFWVVHSLEDGFVGLAAPSLSEAKDLADGLAIVNHVEECDDACKDWELQKDTDHG